MKKAFHRMALVWHPDTIRKTYKYCFANEEAFTALVSEIYKLIDASYRVLNNQELRSQYDSQIHSK